jgi:hypothetical protein
MSVVSKLACVFGLAAPVGAFKVQMDSDFQKVDLKYKRPSDRDERFARHKEWSTFITGLEHELEIKKICPNLKTGRYQLVTKDGLSKEVWIHVERTPNDREKWVSRKFRDGPQESYEMLDHNASEALRLYVNDARKFWFFGAYRRWNQSPILFKCDTAEDVLVYHESGTKKHKFRHDEV